MSKLFKLAARLVRGECLPPCFPDDLPKTTPQKVIRALMDLHDNAKQWALTIREGDDEIRRLRKLVEDLCDRADETMGDIVTKKADPTWGGLAATVTAARRILAETAQTRAN
jgi:hypothetical protein